MTWYNGMDSFPMRLGFTKSKVDSNLYFKVEGRRPMMFLLYVNDPVAEYMDKFFSWGGWLCFLQEDKIQYHYIFPLYFYVLILIKHDEETKLLDKFLDWLHWKSDFA